MLQDEETERSELKNKRTAKRCVPRPRPKRGVWGATLGTASYLYLIFMSLSASEASESEIKV